MYAVIDSAKQYYEDSMKTYQSLNKPVPSPFILPSVEVKLIVTSVSMAGYSNFNNFTDISTQFTSHKDLLLRELSSQYSIQLHELEAIYLEFCRASHGRRIDGKLTKSEFCEMMGSKTSNFSLVQDFFNAIDEYRSGVVDFTSFVVSLSVLRSSYT